MTETIIGRYWSSIAGRSRADLKTAMRESMKGEVARLSPEDDAEIIDAATDPRAASRANMRALIREDATLR